MSPPDRIELTITRTRADYFWGMLFDALHNRLMWLAMLIPPVAEGMFAYSRTEGEPLAVQLTEILTRSGVAMVFVAVVVVALYLFNAAIAWRAPGYLAPIAYAFSQEGVWAKTEATMTDTAWRAYAGAFETRGLMVLRQKTAQTQILPKRALSATTIDNLRRLLREKLGRRAQVLEISR